MTTVINPPGGTEPPQPPTTATTSTNTPPAPPAPSGAATASQRASSVDDVEDEELPDSRLGRALRSERARHRSERERATALERDLVAARVQLGSVETLRRGLVEQAVIAAATGRLADPSDALRMIDLADLDVSADGKLDSEKVRTKIDALVESKPYLSTNGATPHPKPPTQLPGGGARPAGGLSFNDLVRQQLRR